MPKTKSLVTIRPRRAMPVFLCKKCLKRVEDGGKLKKALASELKQASEASGIKRPKVVLTSCLGICPKYAVVVANGATLRAGNFLLLSDIEGVSEAASILMHSENT